MRCQIVAFAERLYVAVAFTVPTFDRSLLHTVLLRSLLITYVARCVVGTRALPVVAVVDRLRTLPRTYTFTLRCVPHLFDRCCARCVTVPFVFVAIVPSLQLPLLRCLMNGDVAMLTFTRTRCYRCALHFARVGDFCRYVTSFCRVCHLPFVRASIRLR